ncbi:four helix bundle protein [Mucilaginibacter sp.]
MVFNELDAWKEASALVKIIYNETALFPKEEVFGLKSQMRRAAVSIPSNIAEGCGRNHRKDTLQFFYVARGSVYELESHLYLANDLNFIKSDTLSLLLKHLEQVRKPLSGLINYCKSKIGTGSGHSSPNTGH